MGQALRRATGRMPSSKPPAAPPELARSVEQRPLPPPAPAPLPAAEGGARDQLGVSGSESVSNTRDGGVLEERDPSYDAMLGKMVGTIKSKPGGRLEMGEAFIVEKYKRPMPKLRSSRADATGSEQKPLPPGTLTVAQLQQIILLHQGKSDEHQGPMEVHDIAMKFNIDAAQVEKIVLFVSLPPEEQSKGSQK